MTANNAAIPSIPCASPEQAEKRFSQIAWAIWLGFTIILGLILAKGLLRDQHTVVVTYRQASLQWLKGQPIYGLNSIHGFLYLPSSAVLGIPLALLPEVVEEFAWRGLSIAALALALARLARVLRPHMRRNIFLGLTLVVIPVSVGSLRAGQMNIPLAAIITLATADALGKRWWPCALWLALAVALKPQALVLALVLAAVVAPLRWRTALAVLVAMALPFLCQSPRYVLDQYHLCLQKLTIAGRPSEAGVPFNDLFGLLQALTPDSALSPPPAALPAANATLATPPAPAPVPDEGTSLIKPETIRWLVRLAAAAITLLASYFLWHRRDHLQSLLAILALCDCYLMLFNPRTEGGSYIILAIPVAVYAAWDFDQSRRWFRAFLMVVVELGWAASYDISAGLWSLAQRWGLIHSPAGGGGVGGGGIGGGGGGGFRNSFGPFWLSPFLTLVFLATLLQILHTRSGPRAEADTLVPAAVA